MPDISMEQAIETAEAAVRNVYKNETLRDVEVEEVEWDSEDWLITLGFTSSKSRQLIGGLTIPLRRLKRMRVDRYTGEFKGMTNAPKREG